MRRSLGFLFLGLILGGIVGYGLRGPAEKRVRQEGAAPSSRSAHLAGGAGNRSAEKQREEDQKILLGDLTTVPFPEIYEILSRQGPDEVARLAAQLDGLPPSAQNSARIKIFFKAWAQLDPTAAFEKATTFHTPETRGTAIGAIITGADPAAAGALAGAIAKLPDDALPALTKAQYFSEAVVKWSEVDPAAAAQFLGATQFGGLNYGMAFYSVAQSWATRDPVAALAWAQQQRQTMMGLSPVNGAVLGWWKKDPAGAEAFALAQIGTPLGKQLITNLVNQMGNDDHAKAAAWVKELPDAELRNQSYQMLASQLAFTDPKAAAVWAMTLPPESIDDAVGSAVSFWAQSDPTAAAGWIQGLSGNARDSAISSYSYATAEADPAAATTWAATIADEKKRASALRSTFRQWRKRDAGAAQAWIESSSLSEAERALLLESLPPPR